MSARVICGAVIVAGLTLPALAQRSGGWSACLNVNGNPDSRLTACTAVIQSRRQTPANRAIAHHIRGYAWNIKNEIDRALADYDQAIRLNPRYADVYMYRGFIWSARGDLDRALADYSRAIRLKPWDANAYNHRGGAYELGGKYEQALSDYNRAIRLNPSFAAAYANRGDVHRIRGELARAISDYTRSIQLDPKNAATRYLYRGFTHFANGDFSASSADLLRGSPGSNDKHAMLFLYLGRARSGSNATGELAENAKRLEDSDWPFPAIQLLLDRRSPEATIDSANSPGQACEANFYVGEWYLLRGDHELAKSHLRYAVESCPEAFIERAAAIGELKRLAH